jgi:hypothetical protein
MEPYRGWIVKRKCTKGLESYLPNLPPIPHPGQILTTSPALPRKRKSGPLSGPSVETDEFRDNHAGVPGAEPSARARVVMSRKTLHISKSHVLRKQQIDYRGDGSHYSRSTKSRRC